MSIPLKKREYRKYRLTHHQPASHEFATYTSVIHQYTLLYSHTHIKPHHTKRRYSTRVYCSGGWIVAHKLSAATPAHKISCTRENLHNWIFHARCKPIYDIDVLHTYRISVCVCVHHTHTSISYTYTLKATNATATAVCVHVWWDANSRRASCYGCNISGYGMAAGVVCYTIHMRVRAGGRLGSNIHFLHYYV